MQASQGQYIGMAEHNRNRCGTSANLVSLAVQGHRWGLRMDPTQVLFKPYIPTIDILASGVYLALLLRVANTRTLQSASHCEKGDWVSIGFLSTDMGNRCRWVPEGRWDRWALVHGSMPVLFGASDTGQQGQERGKRS